MNKLDCPKKILNFIIDFMRSHLNVQQDDYRCVNYMYLDVDTHAIYI